jgi:hypothetical protein
MLNTLKSVPRYGKSSAGGVNNRNSYGFVVFLRLVGFGKGGVTTPSLVAVETQAGVPGASICR